MLSKEFPENQTSDPAIEYDKPAFKDGTVASAMAHDNPNGKEAQLQPHGTASFFKKSPHAEDALGMFILDEANKGVVIANKDTPNRPLERPLNSPNVAVTTTDFFGEPVAHVLNPAEKNMQPLPADSLRDISETDIDSALEGFKEAA